SARRTAARVARAGGGEPDLQGRAPATARPPHRARQRRGAPERVASPARRYGRAGGRGPRGGALQLAARAAALRALRARRSAEPAGLRRGAVPGRPLRALTRRVAMVPGCERGARVPVLGPRLVGGPRDVAGGRGPSRGLEPRRPGLRAQARGGGRPGGARLRARGRPAAGREQDPPPARHHVLMSLAGQVHELLAPGGPIAARWRRYEERPSQRELAGEIAEVLEHGGVLLAEAATGLGKSLAYLLPSVLLAAREDRRVVVATCARLALSGEREGLLPDFDLLVVDEAHRLEGVLLAQLERSVSRHRIEEALRLVGSGRAAPSGPRAAGGLAARLEGYGLPLLEAGDPRGIGVEEIRSLARRVSECREDAEALFRRLEPRGPRHALYGARERYRTAGELLGSDLGVLEAVLSHCSHFARTLGRFAQRLGAPGASAAASELGAELEQVSARFA